MLLGRTAQPGDEGVAEHSADDDSFGFSYSVGSRLDLVEVGGGDEQGGLGVAGEPAPVIRLPDSAESAEHSSGGEAPGIIRRDVPAR